MQRRRWSRNVTRRCVCWQEKQAEHAVKKMKQKRDVAMCLLTGEAGRTRREEDETERWRCDVFVDRRSRQNTPWRWRSRNMTWRCVCWQEKQAEHAVKKKQKRDAAFVPRPETTTPSKGASLVQRGLLSLCLRSTSVFDCWWTVDSDDVDDDDDRDADDVDDDDDRDADDVYRRSCWCTTSHC